MILTPLGVKGQKILGAARKAHHAMRRASLNRVDTESVTARSQNLALMAETNSKLQGLLSQRPDRPFHLL